ncbi:MAG TPA: cytidylate kinase-like family protein [Planctomycetota bacterium]|nr:cytidylate kinase-like family protein [Planctomycetota bacterium]
MARSLGVLVDHQARRSQLKHERREAVARRPVLAMALQYGAGGEEVVASLAKELALEVFDREIVRQIAESTHRSERVVSTLDHNVRRWTADWLESLASHDFLSSTEYRHQLAQVVGAIAHHGGAIILGHGAHLVLGEGEALRVLLVAPLGARVAAVMRAEGLGERMARRRVVEVEAARQAALAHRFHVDLNDPTRFDLVVNTARLGVPGSVAAIRAAVEQRLAASSH